MKKNILKFITIVLLISITACSPSNLLSKETATYTPIIPTLTTTPSLTPTLTDTPVPTPSSTPIPAEEKESILQTYKILLFIQIDVNMLDQIATKVNNGELTGYDSFGSLLALATLVNAVDEAIPQTSIPEIVKPHWDQAIPIHDSSKDLISRWFNEEIISTDVLEETPPLLERIDKIMNDFEKELEATYGFDAQDLSKTREDTIKSIDEIFVTSTPQP